MHRTWLLRQDAAKEFKAGIAQLVEHNLAKVGVASSSLVSRSKFARVVKSVDTRDLKSLGFRAVAVQVRPRAPFKIICNSIR